MTKQEPLGYRPFANLEHRNFLQAHIEVPLFVRSLGLPTGARLLEVGCGHGVALPVFARLLNPRLIVGIDIELAFVRLARQRCTSGGVASALRADLRVLPFADGSFDVVADFGTCYHVDHAENAILEIARVLAPGGVFATETKLAQVLAHPIRTRGRRLPRMAESGFSRKAFAGMWVSYTRVG